MKALLAPLTLLALAACQPTVLTPLESPKPPVASSPSAPASPAAPVASASPSPPGPFLNPQVLPGCNGGYRICPEGSPCPQLSCAAPAPEFELQPTQFIPLERHPDLAARFGLNEISRAGDELGALTPAVPLVRAFKIPCSEGSGLYRTNSRRSACVVYVAEASAGQAELLDSAAKIKARFGPVSSAAEALALAVMVSGHLPRFQLAPPLAAWRYFATSLTPTQVIAQTSEAGAGYQLNLFDYKQFGCGPHPHTEVSYTVTEQGDVKETARRKLYEDPAEDGLCVD